MHTSGARHAHFYGYSDLLGLVLLSLLFCFSLAHVPVSSVVHRAMQVTSTINGILKGPSNVYLSHRGELLVRGLAASLAAHVRFPSSGKRLAHGVVRTS